MHISNSLEFATVFDALNKQIHTPSIKWSHRRDLLKLLDNIEDSVHELSKIEVEYRRRPSTGLKVKVDDRLEKINSDIEQLEQYITFGLLL
jgi:hypothetical protein